MTSDIDPVKAAVTCEECGIAQPYHPVLAVECPDCGAAPGRKCQRPSGHRVRNPHADRVNAAYDAGYTKCPCKTDNAVICAGSTVPEDVPFDTDAVTIEATPDEMDRVDPDTLAELPCSLGDDGLPPAGSKRRDSRTRTRPRSQTASKRSPPSMPKTPPRSTTRPYSRTIVESNRYPTREITLGPWGNCHQLCRAPICV